MSSRPPRVGVVLSGCGVFDGTEIHESVIALLALDRAGAEVICAAPDVEFAVIDHRTGEATGERRNVLVEAARIARGEIRDVAEVRAEELDAIVFPGGFGAAKNLCDFASQGSAARVQPDVARLVADMLAARKPVGGICIAPAMLAACLRDQGREGSVTIGTDAEAAGNIEAMGQHHLACPVQEFRVDEENGIVTTPAYMLAGRISEAAEGIERLVAEVLRRVGRAVG